MDTVFVDQPADQLASGLSSARRRRYTILLVVLAVFIYMQ